MNWLQSLVVTVLTGIVGMISGGLVMNVCVDWYRISSFEGKSGYAIVGIALLGGVAGLVMGLIAARMVAAGAEPGFFKALGAGSGAVLGLALAALAVCRLGADIAPTMDGRDLELEIEVRCPKGFQFPQPDEYGATAEVVLPGRRRQPSAKLNRDKARTEGERWIVPALVPLTTSSAQKYVSVRFNAGNPLLFNLPLRSHPEAGDLEWSAWVDSGWDPGKPEPATEAKFNLRYRVRLVEPSPPPPDPADEQARKFAALPPDAPLENWLPFLFQSPADDRTKIVIQRINERQAELPQLIRSTNATLREYALRATTCAEKPTPEITEAVLAEGRDIAAGIRQANELQTEDPAFSALLADLRSRFDTWKHAWWGLSERLGVDGRPPMKEIHDLATVRARGTAMDDIGDSARFILDKLDQSAAEKKP